MSSGLLLRQCLREVDRLRLALEPDRMRKPMNPIEHAEIRRNRARRQPATRRLSSCFSRTVAMAGHSGALNTARTVVPDQVSNEDVRQRLNLLVLTIAALSMACSAGPLPTPPPGPGVPRPDTRQTRSVDPVVFPEAVSLSLTQEFGYAPMRYCTLEVAIYQPFSRVALECLHQDGVVIRAGRDLRAEESDQIFKFASGAGLFQGGHSGEDLTPGDGTLETLKVRAGETGRAVVLITSYNATFEDNAARRELLRLLKAFEGELSKQLKRST